MRRRRLSLSAVGMTALAAGLLMTGPIPVQAAGVATIDSLALTSSGSDDVSYTGYPCAGCGWEAFVSATNPDPLTIGSNPGVPAISGQSAIFSLNQVDGTAGYNSPTTSGDLEDFGGSGSFSITLANGNYNVLSGNTAGGYIVGTLGQATAQIYLTITNLTSDFFTGLPSFYDLELSGNVATGSFGNLSPSVLQVGTDPFCGQLTYTCSNDINSFYLDYGVSFTSNPNLPPGGVPEPSTLALLGSGLVGLWLVRRGRRNA